MILLYENDLTNCTLTPSSENSNFPFETAFSDKRLTRYGYFTGYTAENLFFYKPSGLVFNTILIANNNLTENAVVKFECNYENDFTSPALSVTLERLENGYYYYNFGANLPDALGYANYYIDASSSEYVDEDGEQYADWDKTYFVYCRLTFADSTNTTPVKISKIFFGDYLQMPAIERDIELPRTSNSDVMRNISGQIFSDKRVQLISAKVSFPIITNDKRKEINNFFQAVDITEPFFLVPYENEMDFEPPFYSVLKNSPSFKKSDYYFKLDFTFEEVK